jgi:DNA-binding NtrC family response regulator
LTKTPAVPAGKERILVVNDMEGPCEIICATLSAAGYQCRQATNGVEALAILESGEQFDLLLSNFMMPKMNGLELLERTRERFSDIPFVFESGCDDLTVFLAAVRNGAYDYLQMPFEREQLLVVVRRALEYRRLKLENRELRAKLEDQGKR